jgi:hypothetical protein
MRHAILTWRGTWDLEFGHDEVVFSRKVVPDAYGLWVENERLLHVTINSHGDAAYYLRLPSEVMDPVSLWQILQEGEWQRRP